MPCHAVEIVSAPTQDSDPASVPEPGPPDFTASLLSDRVEQNVKGTLSAVLSEQESPLSNVPEDVDVGIPEHIRGRYRFDEADTKTAVLDAIENDVVADAEWYEIRHHECTHDGDGGPCPGWTTERSAGTVPSGV